MKKSVKTRKIGRLRRRLFFSFFTNFGEDFAWNLAKQFYPVNKLCHE